MRRRDTRQRGLSLVEVIVATTLAGGIMLLGLRLAGTTSDAATASHRRTTISVRVADAAEAVVRDLQVAGLSGEDRNLNGTLDSDEDTNNNGVLDADWSLPNGGTAASITFNKVQKRWIWGPPVTYSIQNGILVRVVSGQTREICRDVTSFSLTRTGDRVRISLESSGTDGKGKVWSDSAERTVYVRN
jgi:type II secretory pathway pseudopilin PulG